MTRLQYYAAGSVVTAVLAAGMLSAQSIPGNAASCAAGLHMPAAFPCASYTPHGYLDNPWHSMIASRSGVVRSVPPLGMGWWRMGFQGAYGNGPSAYLNYVSFLNLAVAIDNVVFAEPEDFAVNSVGLESRWHTKHLLSYDWRFHDISVSAHYFLPREHTLACWVEVNNTGAEAKTIRLSPSQLYQLGPVKWWGADGFAVHRTRTADASIAHVWAYGDVFALGATVPASARMATGNEEQWKRWIRIGGASADSATAIKGRGPVWMSESYQVTVPAGSTSSILICLSRGVNEAAAVAELRIPAEETFAALQRQLTGDEQFWSACPVLEGDWPEHWKQGWVYDYETLRMNVRPPVGIFKHRWDAMQVHSPRSVLGETSLDMMTLSYADPACAQEVLYGIFADAIAPNVPCVREDGSVNMVSSDGSECGTAPMWGYPFHVINSIRLASADTTWIHRLYPFLKAYCEWWLHNRTDGEGWFHCNNSWESGQDGSRRFLVAEHNEAAVADFVRTVDVEASMGEAMALMERFAIMSNRSGEAAEWKRLAEQRVRNVRSMFHDGWYRDVDARTGKPIILEGFYDVSMLSPLTCGLAAPEQAAALRPRLQWFHKRGIEWPPALQTFAEAAWTAGEHRIAGEAVAEVVNRVYRRTDQRSLLFVDSTESFCHRIPGVANEYWPVRNIVPGGENYGWGATLPMHVLRSIVGFRERDEQSFYLTPAFPVSMMTPGVSYGVRHLRYRSLTFDVRYSVRSSNELEVVIESIGDSGKTLAASQGAKPLRVKVLKQATGTAFSFTVRNGESYSIRIKD